MSDYTKLVKALRIVEKEQDCNECEAGRWHHDFNCCLFADAAAAIEALEHELNVQKNMLENLLSNQIDALINEPKRGDHLDSQPPEVWDRAHENLRGYFKAAKAKMEVQE